MTVAQTLRGCSYAVSQCCLGIGTILLAGTEEYSSKIERTHSCWPESSVPYLVNRPIGWLTMWLSWVKELRGTQREHSQEKLHPYSLASEIVHCPFLLHAVGHVTELC